MKLHFSDLTIHTEAYVWHVTVKMDYFKTVLLNVL
jgi:hypothetical protein